MSLKRYAIIAAVSYHNSQQQQQKQKSNTTMQTIRKQQQLIKAPQSTMATKVPTKGATIKSTSINATTYIATIAGATSTIPTDPTIPTNATEKNISTNWIALNVSNTTNTLTTMGVGSGNTGAVSSNGNSITTYYGGGLGLFHQQNLRSNGGAGGGYLNGNGNTGNNVGNGGGVSYPNTINGNVNLLLGGAMLSLVTTILCVVCYCCHRNIKKRTEAAYRQQRQWLENDPNMEIYSVEQCYETSGLFLGESTDGLSTIPTLHHEPPPSYDAVVAMQEQLLQQQQHLQRTSPPPGYRSSLDVSAITTAFASAVTAVGSRGTLDNITTNDSNGNLSSVASGHSNIYQQKTNQILGNNMKKVLQAQSCCSLQRAEVENMWNAAAAAVAARSSTTHAQTSRTNTTDCTTAAPAMLMMTRKSLPTYAFGRHYRQQKSYYRRGCPLCGKFRYDTEDALSISTESELDNQAPEPVVATTSSYAAGTCNEKENNNKAQQLLHTNKPQGSNYGECNNNNNNNNNCVEDQLVMTADGIGRSQQAIMRQSDEIDECLCDSTYSAPRRRHSRQSVKNPEALYAPENDELNGNDAVPSVCPTENQLSAEVTEAQYYQNYYEETASSDVLDDNANTTRLTPTTNASLDGATGLDNVQIGQVTTTATKTSDTVDLSSINENGIVRLDMSKIIDKTGLPTYEAALKLESSGYV